MIITECRVDDLTIRREEDADLDGRLPDQWVWTTRDTVPLVGGGEDSGRLLIRFMVDGDFDAVHADLGPTSSLQAIDRAIESLTVLRHQMVRVNGDTARAGRCMAHGDWGRCYGDHQHHDEHTFPKGPNG